MKINWLVRLKNKQFWVVFIPTVLLLIQQVAGLFGFHLELGGLGDKLLDLVETAFIMLALFGVVIDPTTKGISDSSQALKYYKPKG